MTALELAALAGISRVLGEPLRHGDALRHAEPVAAPLSEVEAPPAPSMPEDDEVLAEMVPVDETIPEDPSMPQGASIAQGLEPEASRAVAGIPQHDGSDSLEFLGGDSDAQARYYRASDEQIELLVAFFSDGRVRLIDSDGRRFAGMLETEKADLIEIGSNEWSRVFVSATPDGRTQLELQGGPHDTHVLICEALPG